MIKDKAVWLFGGGAMQELAAKKIKNSKIQLLITDINPDCYCSKYADEFINLDTFNVQGNLDRAASLKDKYEIKGVVTVAADCHETVAHVAKYLQLPGIDPEISNICRQKHKTREILTNAGLYQPSFKLVNNIHDARIFATEQNVPVVMKSTDNSGSRGFSYIKSSKDINNDNYNLALENGTSGKVMIEESLEPRDDIISEQSVETLWVNGKMHWLNWVDRIFRSDLNLLGVKTEIYNNLGWAVEIGHINPALHDDVLKNNVKDIIHQAGVAIGFDRQNGAHILKADIMLTNNGPIIIELTPRLSGGWDSSGTTPARGADFIGGAIQLSIGKPFNKDLWNEYFNYKNSEIFSVVMSKVIDGAVDCIGRRFVLVNDIDRKDALIEAITEVNAENFI